MSYKLFEGCEIESGVDYLENREYYNSLGGTVVYTGTIDGFYDYCFGRLEYRSLRFETEVLQPMLTGEAFSYRPYDAHAVCFLPEVIVSPKKVTIIEGSYACHPRLRRSYALRIFLTVDRQEQLERIRKRNGEEREEMFERIWIPLEERYFWKAGVEKTCDISLDTTGLFEG